MKLKIILALLSLSVIAEAQRSFVNRPHVRAALKSSWVTALDATKSQYWSGTPVAGTLDLNGSELLPNPTMDANVTGWSAGGGGNAYSTVVKRTGAGSLRFISTANSVTIYNSPFVTNTTTNKFTGEVWVYNQSASASAKGLIALASRSGTQVTLTQKTWVKLTVNVVATGADLYLSINLSSLSVGDTLYIDDASLTQSYDAHVWVGGVNAGDRTFGLAEGIIDIGNVPRLTLQGNNGLKNVYSDNCDNSSVEFYDAWGTIADGKSHSVGLSWNRTGTQNAYIDGAKAIGSSITTMGKVNGIGFIYAGRYSSSAYYSGTIGQTIIMKGTLPSDIDNIIARWNREYKAGKEIKPVISGMECVLNVPWDNGGKDKSGKGNHLTPQGGATARRK